MKPNVGMKHPVAALVDTYTPGTSITYDDGCVVAEARGATLNWEGSDGEFYGDDVLLDSDVSIVGYTLDFEPSGLKTAVRAMLLGEKELEDNGGYRITGKGSPDVGFGYVRVMREDDEDDGTVGETYEAWWFYRLKFKINSEETRTKEKSLEWRVPTLNGKGMGIFLDDSGEPAFADHKDFESYSDAVTWLENMAGIEAASDNTQTETQGSTTPSSP